MSLLDSDFGDLLEKRLIQLKVKKIILLIHVSVHQFVYQVIIFLAFTSLEILREHHEASKTDNNLLPYLPIPHVRDMLIPPSDRFVKMSAYSNFSLSALLIIII